ncbi:MAG: hypothetical protein NTY38_01295 [Acidobacteria bacterium]|nr:hypothetical protein [Acidobacteriota bacterium]
MTIRTWMAVAALFAATTCCAGEPRQLSLRWSELGERAGGSKVAVVLPDATRIEGRVMQVEPEGLRLKVSKTSDRKTHPKGPSLIPRASITFLRVIEYRQRPPV